LKLSSHFSIVQSPLAVAAHLTRWEKMGGIETGKPIPNSPQEREE